MQVKEILNQLHPLEQRLLPHIKEDATVEDLAESSGMQEIEVMRALQWLENKKVLRIKVALQERVSLGKNGEAYKKQGMPEFKFLQQISKGKKLSEINLSEDEKRISIGILKRQGAINISKKDNDLFIEKTDKAAELSEESYKSFFKRLPADFSSFT